MKNEGVSEQWSKETTCTTRTPESYVYGGVTDSRLQTASQSTKKPPKRGLSLEPVACSYGLAWFSLLLAYLAVSVLTATDIGGKGSG